MRIGIDAMGGDFAPSSPVKGGLQFLHDTTEDHQLVFFGDEYEIEQELNNSRYDLYKNSIEIIPTTQKIGMDESPARVIKEKKDSSMVVGLQHHQAGKTDAFISAGNTGAQMAASLLTLKRIPGVNRPVIGTFLPAQKGVVLLLDVGANTDRKPINLLQFAIMGSIYLTHIYELESPRVGLLSIGEESNKGNDLTKKTYPLLVEKVDHFIGNVEGRDIMKNKAQVIVCDGFVGNIVLKFAESVFGVITHGFKRHLGTNLFSNIGALLVKPTFKKVRMSYDYEEYGGVPLLGINGISIICHGSSSPKAICNAIRVAVTMREKNVNEHIKEKLDVNKIKGRFL